MRFLRKNLAKELPGWIDRGIITAEQARSICALYGADYDSLSTRGDLARYLLIALGYLFVGLAAITIVAANWDDIPRGLRMAVLMGLTVSVQALAAQYMLSERRMLGEGLFILGNLLFGASIILIAQIYHLGEYMPDGVFAWAVGTFAVAAAATSAWSALLGSALALLWLGMRTVDGYFPVEYPFFLAFQLYLLAKGPYSPMLCRLALVGGLMWTLKLAESVWWIGMQEHDPENAPVFFASAGALLLFTRSLGFLLKSRRSAGLHDYGQVLANWSTTLGFVCVFVLSLEASRGSGLIAHLEPTAWGMVLLAALLGLALWITWIVDNRLLLFAPAIAYMTILPGMLLAVDGVRAVYLAIATTAALIAGAVVMVVSGARRSEARYYYGGVAVILFVATIRYFDQIEGYVGRALWLAALAAVLFASSWGWSAYMHRKEIQ